MPNFIDISPLVPGKKIFKVFTIRQPSWSCDQHHVNDISLYLKTCIQYLVENDPVVSEKGKFYFSYENDLRQRSRMTLSLNTHISSLSRLVACIYQHSGLTLQ